MSATLATDGLFPQASAPPEALPFPSKLDSANNKRGFFDRFLEATGRTYCVQTVDGEHVLILAV